MDEQSRFLFRYNEESTASAGESSPTERPASEVTQL